MPEPYPCDEEQWTTLDDPMEGMRCVLDEDHEGPHIYERIGDEP